MLDGVPVSSPFGEVASGVEAEFAAPLATEPMTARTVGPLPSILQTYAATTTTVELSEEELARRHPVFPSWFLLMRQSPATSIWGTVFRVARSIELVNVALAPFLLYVLLIGASGEPTVAALWAALLQLYIGLPATAVLLALRCFSRSVVSGTCDTNTRGFAALMVIVAGSAVGIAHTPAICYTVYQRGLEWPPELYASFGLYCCLILTHWYTKGNLLMSPHRPVCILDLSDPGFEGNDATFERVSDVRHANARQDRVLHAATVPPRVLGWAFYSKLYFTWVQSLPKRLQCLECIWMHQNSSLAIVAYFVLFPVSSIENETHGSGVLLWSLLNWAFVIPLQLFGILAFSFRQWGLKSNQDFYIIIFGICACFVLATVPSVFFLRLGVIELLKSSQMSEPLDRTIGAVFTEKPLACIGIALPLVLYLLTPQKACEAYTPPRHKYSWLAPPADEALPREEHEEEDQETCHMAVV